MIELIFGVLIGLVIAMIIPDAIETIRNKVISVVDKNHNCKK